LEELAPPPLAIVQAAEGDPPPPEMPSRSPPSHVHSIPLEVSQENPDDDFWKDPPSSFVAK